MRKPVLLVSHQAKDRIVYIYTAKDDKRLEILDKVENKRADQLRGNTDLHLCFSHMQKRILISRLKLR